MKILHIIKQVNNGGGCLGMLAQCKLTNNNFEHTILSLKEADSQIKIMFESENIKVINLSDISNVSNFLKQFDINQFEWWNNPEINKFILKTEISSSRWLLYIRVNTDAPLMCPSFEIIKKMDYIFVNSPTTLNSKSLNKVCEEAGKKVDKAAFASTSFKPEFVSKSQREYVHLGYLGTVDPIKIYPRFIDIIEEIYKKQKNVRFSFAGDGLLDSLRVEVQKRKLDNIVEFKGHLTNVNEFLQDLDIFFYPLNKFTYAASEKALQEAMLSSIPPIVFPFGGIPDLVEDGITGLVAKDESEFVGKTISLIESIELRRNLGTNARTQTEKFISQSNILQTLLDIYSQVTNIQPTAKYELEFEAENLLKISSYEYLEWMKRKDILDYEDSNYLLNFIQESYPRI